jgi:hypothetical protein
MYDNPINSSYFDKLIDRYELIKDSKNVWNSA